MNGAAAIDFASAVPSFVADKQPFSFERVHVAKSLFRGPNMRVLIVEDEPNLGRQLRATLEGAGYAIDLATDGEDGHYLGSTENYDAIILDLGLPEVDGLTVLDRWRKEGKRDARPGADRARQLVGQGRRASTPAPTIISPSRSRPRN